MNKKLHILHLEDSRNDAELIKETLAAGGIECEIVLVDSRADFTAALEREQFDIILADYDLPAFNGLSALAIASAKRYAAPFLFVTGTMGEEIAVESLKHGATDFVVKSHLGRLVPSVRRALKEMEERTERKLAEESLRRTQAYTESVLSSVADTHILFDREWRYLYVNEAASRAIGRPREELLGRTLWEVFPDIAGTDLGRDYHRAMSERVPLAFEYYYPAFDQWWDNRFYPAEEGLAVFATDITEKKNADAALRESEEKFRHLVENLGKEYFFYRHDTNGVFTYVSPSVTDMLGYLPQDVVSHYSEYLTEHPINRNVAQHTDLSLRGIQQAPYLVEVLHKNKSTRWLEVSEYPVRDDSSGSIVAVEGIARDITERKKLEAQLLHAQKMEAVGTLAGGIAHDFNNILNVIIGYGSLVLEEMGADHASRDRMREVLAAADRAANLTKRLLMFSRKEVVDFKHIQVNDVVSGIENLLSRIIGEDIELTIKLEDQDATIFADAGQLEQVLMNLATNARDAMPKGGSLTISTGSAEIDDDYIAAYGYGTAGKYAFISVADTGVGMNAETQSKIFEPYYTTKGLGEGTGLGLSIAYEIIKQHKGFMQVYSEVGIGTLFKILLPLSDKPTGEHIVTDTSAPRGGTETILIAEDEAPLRNLMRIILESFGYTVLAAEDGEEVVRMFLDNRDKVRLVILDLIMPKKSGKDAADEIKKVQPGVRTLFLSGYSEDMMRKKGALEEGLVFIQKPSSPKVLLTKVRELLDA